ncbi:Wadjet anti-phage system protein JetD domain-containing protein [Streptomyces sp. NBC_01446]|uniref:Wadjet anti-phage system protein JetD domain-containing protein n=1 Tax=Streptomyces sp. NBC_01446 TaxID=2903870 RepID=UPI00225B797E|nr:Wadjet anti-phage system protein JetD domain-containing protein [Streptomyces sp. NBC_01446]MCX4648046.1 DUF2220 domain-containing protein [Streptomyces sp. NBC_01446]
MTAHQGPWVKEPRPIQEHLQSLTGEEADLYQSLVDDDFGHGVRLEQERIRFSAVETAPAGLHGSSSHPPHDAGWPVHPQDRSEAARSSGIGLLLVFSAIPKMAAPSLLVIHSP